MRTRQNTFIFLLFVSLHGVFDRLEAASHVSVKGGLVGSTLGKGSAVGFLFERIPDRGFGMVSDVSVSQSIGKAYAREMLWAGAGVDLAFSKYLSLVSLIAFKTIANHIENEFAVIDAKTESVGVSNGLHTRMTFGSFYLALEWITVFTPLSTNVFGYRLAEKQRITASETDRIANSFYRAETNGHAVLLSPRFGYTF